MRRVCPARHPSPKKSSLASKRDDRFLALLGDDADLHLALLDIEDRIGNVSLRKDDLPLAVSRIAATLADFGKEDFWIERRARLVVHRLASFALRCGKKSILSQFGSIRESSG